MNELVPLTKTELGVLEETVRTGLASFLEVGRALKAIKERNGFKLRGFETFDEYCEKQFHFSERNGFRMIAAAETADRVKKATGDMPKNEASARVLGQVAHDPKLLARVQERLAKTGEKISTATAEKIAVIVEAVRPKTRPMFDEKPKATLPVLKDVCPKCEHTPDYYAHRADGWHCSLCDTLVLVGVVAMDAKACPTCGFTVTDASTGFCSNCGGEL